MKKHTIFLLFLLILLPTKQQFAAEATNNNWKTLLSSWWHNLSPEKKATVAITAQEKKSFVQNERLLTEKIEQQKEPTDEAPLLFLIEGPTNGLALVEDQKKLKEYPISKSGFNNLSFAAGADLVNPSSDTMTDVLKKDYHIFIYGYKKYAATRNDSPRNYLFIYEIIQALEKDDQAKVLLRIDLDPKSDNNKNPGMLEITKGFNTTFKQQLDAAQTIALWSWLHNRMQKDSRLKKRITIPSTLPNSLLDKAHTWKAPVSNQPNPWGNTLPGYNWQ